jgi:hypothetical protein
VRGHDRHARRLEHVVVGLIGDVRDVDDHAEVVHRPHDRPPEVGEAAVPSRVAGRVAPVVRVHVRQRQVPRAAAVEIAQQIERVLDGVAAFDADHQRRLSFALRGADRGRIGGEEELVRQPARLFVDRLDEPVRELRGAAARIRRRDVRGEERSRDPAGPQRGEVRLRLGVVLVEVDVVAEEAVRRVAVAVDDDRAAVDGGSFSR